MKKVVVMIVLAVFTVGAVMAQNDSVPENAKTEKQEKKKGGFSSFLKKVGEQATGINMTDEPFTVNPLSAVIDVEFTGAYGDASTGLVSLVFKVKNKTYETRASFGGSLDKTAAFDKNGKTYKPYNSASTGFDAPKGIWVEIRLEGKYKGALENVPETLEAFELINVYCYINANNRGLIEFRNIPIQWGVVPE